jgi:aspartyl protease family protein
MLAGRLLVATLAFLLIGMALQFHFIDLPQRLKASLAENQVGIPPFTGHAQLVSADSVHIRRGPGGHFVAELLVERTPVKVLIDTGATALILRESDAAAAGLHVMPSDFDIPVETANGASMLAGSRADEVELGPFRLSDVAFGVSRDRDLPISLLGMNVLAKLGRIEFDDQELVIAPKW